MNTPCIEWTKYVTPGGYGRTVVPVGNGKYRGVYAHRLAYERAYGPIPAGLTVDHMCFNTICVNPEHLRLLTAEDNSRNTRQALGNVCPNGHAYSPWNTYGRERDGVRQRECRTCISDRNKAYRRRRRALEQPVRRAS